MEDGRPGIGWSRVPGGPTGPAGSAGPGLPTVPHPRRAPLSESRPHPTGGGVVGTYVHAYDPFLPPYPSPIPPMRPAQDVTAGASPTPIYDALYSEYRRTFRTLPGDRSGEEELSFRAFGTAVSTGVYGPGQGPRYASAYPTAWSTPSMPSSPSGPYSSAHPQAALPPGPRRGV
ncbi:hypothetical protein SVEN_1387 [Streptomyces venezuelae ATCC 10712]|uniref:Uncharacterized protein n=2 Tax=Streptomyces venezuelae TaxID=54571 RepID=F2RF94_STRVP|nr:hypothetical protein SVEN_1387 [Streptomyces venezuelae ATCC 10712]